MITQLAEVADFFVRLSKTEIVNPDGLPAEELAKFMNVPLPDALKGFTIRSPKEGDKRGTHVAVIRPMTWLMSFFSLFVARTKCFVACGDLPIVGFRCVTVCVTCLESWPGPACRINIYHNFD